MSRTRPIARHKTFLHVLESRLLLSQTPLPISVSFANTTLTSETTPGQIAPTLSAGTDFRYASTTAPNALAQITRSFTITNTANITLNLSNVSLSGANAADFSILSALPTSLAPGSPATLTIAFNPSVIGTRTATLTIPDASNTDSPFLFDVQGTGIATTNFPNGLEIATILPSSGNATAANGDVLSMSYLGYLFNGSVFDATSLHGGTPFTLTLDSTPTRDFIAHNPNRNLIDGWEQGLQGMKQGETRILIIPSSLGYGVNGSPPSIPGNAPLVFETFLNELDYAPELGVGGTDFSLIPAGSATTSTTNGTDFGTLPLGQTSSSQTFPIADFSNAFDSTGARINSLNYNNMTVTFSGPNASDFAFTAGNPITAGNLGNFTITFTPTAPGLRTATVHIHSNDQFNPDYTFAVQGIGAPIISLSANNLSIPNGESVTTTDNFTDFRYQSLSPTDPVTRTYTITNTGFSNLSLANLTLAGANPTDFSIASAPALSSLAPNQSTTFTIRFNPTAAGNRAAIITLPSDAPPGLFSFAVSGIGVATTTTTANIRYATVQTGTGNATASNGELLQITFQAAPLTGTFFSGNASFRLDNAPGHPYITNDQFGPAIKNAYDYTQIDGLENGLQGIRAGETRLLFLPAAQTVGATANGSLLPNQPLLFLVTCTALSYAPRIGVSGNGVTIPSGSATPTTANNTDLGTLTGTQSSLSNTFVVFNNSFVDDINGNPVQNLSFGGAPAISFTGPNASEFGVTGSSGHYLVTFRPTGTGLRTATIHFASNDPENPDYSFAIQATNNASPNLQLSLGITDFPTTTIPTNTNAVLSLPITITNIGANTAIPNPTTDIQIFAHNSATGANILLAAYPALNISLNPNAAAPYTLNAPIPLTLPTGTYTLLALINQSNAISDPDPTNNFASTNQSFSVNAIYNNLTPNILSTTLPKSLLAKTPMSGTITFNITNTGTLPLPKTQQATITLLARNTTTGATIPLLTLPPQSLANLKPNAKIVITTPLIKLPAGLPAGAYTLQARITPVQKLPQSSTADDTATSTFTLTMNPPTYDLTGTLNSSSLKSTPTNVTGNLNLTLRTLGNANLPDTQSAQLQIIAHPATGPDILLSTQTVNLATLSPQKPLTLNLPITSNKPLKAGRYQLEVRILPTPKLAELNSLNNLLATKPLFLLSTNK